ncbi:MAG: hypothetical protein ABIK07_14580 [Planctomycetota bacterium]
MRRFIVLFPYLSYQNEVNDMRFDLAVPTCVAGHMPAYLLSENRANLLQEI